MIWHRACSQARRHVASAQRRSAHAASAAHQASGRLAAGESRDHADQRTSPCEASTSTIVVEPTFDAAGSIDADTVQRASSTIQRSGVAILPRLYRGKCFDDISSRFVGLTDTVLRDLAERSAPIEIGSAHGFHEICLRSKGRYDVTASFGDFTAEQLEPIEAIVRDERVLGYV